MPLSASTHRLLSDEDAAKIGCVDCLSPPAKSSAQLHQLAPAASTRIRALASTRVRSTHIPTCITRGMCEALSS